MKKYNCIIIDGNNLFHRNYSVQLSKGKTETVEVMIADEKKKLIPGSVYGFIQSLQKIEREHLSEVGKVYVLFDNFSSKETQRKEIDPEYKSNRNKKDPEYKNGIEYLKFILLNYADNISIVYREDYEADDLVYPLIQQQNQRDNVLVISNDLDWAVNISDNVDWLRKDKMYTKEIFIEEYKFPPSAVVLYKTFKGDESDNIPIAVKGFREADLIQIVNKYSTIYDVLYDLVNLPVSDIWKEKIKENSSRLKLNQQLVERIGVKKEEIDEFVYKGKFNPAYLRVIYQNLKFNVSSLDKRLMQSFPEKKKITSDSFFIKDKIGRV